MRSRKQKKQRQRSAKIRRTKRTVTQDAPPPGIAPQALKVPEFAKRNGIGLDKAYQEIRAGRLRAVKAGKRTLIFLEAEQAWRDSLPVLELRYPPREKSECDSAVGKASQLKSTEISNPA
jgi:hypothetical protein